MASGDREWEELGRRLRDGVPIDPATASCQRLAAAYAMKLPFG
jgi:hypothetical protein